MDDDPIFAGEGDLDAARSLVEKSPDAQLFLYSGDQHYFAEPGLRSYRPEAAALLTSRIRDFLAALS
jgi:dienelactone hydrolase